MKILRITTRLLGYAALAYGGYAAYTFLKYGQRKKAEPSPSLDRFMPDPEIIEQQSVAVKAPANVIYDAARNYNLTHSRIAHLLFDTRRIAMGSKPARAGFGKAFADQMTEAGWTILDEKPGEEIIFGVAAQPWLADPGFRTIPPEDFATFNEPGWVKIAFNVAVQSGSVLRTETRVVSTDAEARRRFRKYWAFVLPGVKLVRFELLRAMKAQAETAAIAIAAA